MDSYDSCFELSSEQLPDGTWLIRGLIAGNVDFPRAVRLTDETPLLAPPGPRAIMFDLRGLGSITPEARLHILKYLSGGSRHGTLACAIIAHALLTRLSVAGFALASRDVPIRAFDSQEGARSWLERVCRARVASREPAPSAVS